MIKTLKIVLLCFLILGLIGACAPLFADLRDQIEDPAPNYNKKPVYVPEDPRVEDNTDNWYPAENETAMDYLK